MGKTPPPFGIRILGGWEMVSGEPRGVCLIFFSLKTVNFFKLRISKSFPAYPYPKPKIPGTLNSHLGGPFDDASIAPHSEDPKG